MNAQQVLLQLAIELARAASDRDALQVENQQLKAHIQELQQPQAESSEEEMPNT